MKKKYFFKISTSYVAKNKLEKEIIAFMRALDHTLIEGTDSREKFIRDLEQGLADLSKKHPRCREQKLHGWGSKIEIQSCLGVYGVIEGVLYEVIHDKTCPCL